jgi:hypothetical protein
MDRLDEVCHYGWHRKHEELKGRIYAGIGIVLPSGSTMWRWDCGTESNTEAEKGESSDSFKRAAVNYGVGRFLYDLKIQYVDANEKKTKDNYPYVVDSNKNKVWDITKHINGGSQSKSGREEKKEEKKEERNWIAEIKAAKDLPTLRKIYDEAISATDKSRQTEIIREKDKRKIEISELGGNSQSMRND